MPFICNECVVPRPTTTSVPALFTEEVLKKLRDANLINKDLLNEEFYPFNCQINT